MASAPQLSAVDALATSAVALLTDAASLELFAHDVYERGADLVAVAQPADTAELSRIVCAATSQGMAIIPRGGGMSYTGGLIAPERGALLIDTGKMDRVLDINETDMTVTVEAGCSWAKLYETLKPKGLRTPFWGTLSGLVATVGGAMSQNGAFWGSGRHGSAVQSCISLEVVLADGIVVNTGAAHMRPVGPDLTGLFLGDCGAFGVKATVTLRLVREAAAHGFASFTFKLRDDVLAAITEISHADIATECFGFDPSLNAIRMQRDSIGSDAKALVGMMKAQGSIFKALKEGAKVVAAGRNFIDDAQFSLHILTEGRNQPAAEADLATAKNICGSLGGVEIENTIPKIIRANPFGPLNSMLGPGGQRWVPIHGVVAHSKAATCYAAIEALFEAECEAMKAHGIFSGTLLAAVGGAGIIIEPCLYWPDATNPVHEATVESSHFAKLPTLPANPEALAVTKRIKQRLVDLFHEYDAGHFQIGRAYRYRDGLDPAADALLQAIKAQLDPQTRMNPGVLGL